jgi:hypothetical protein
MFISLHTYEAEGEVQNGASKVKARMPKWGGALPPATCAAGGNDWVLQRLRSETLRATTAATTERVCCEDARLAFGVVSFHVHVHTSEPCAPRLAPGPERWGWAFTSNGYHYYSSPPGHSCSITHQQLRRLPISSTSPPQEKLENVQDRCIYKSKGRLEGS